MVITKGETFGPVAPLYRFKTDAEAIKMANDTEFGLAAYFYSRDIGRTCRRCRGALLEAAKVALASRLPLILRPDRPIQCK
jgi:acyl-CoA reductase-like NAD-dependent aldehyde dehydrogenase